MGRLFDELVQPRSRFALEPEAERARIRAAESADNLRDLHRVWHGEHDGKERDERGPYRRNEKPCCEEDHAGDRAEYQYRCDDRQRSASTRQRGRERKPSISHSRTVAAGQRLGSTSCMQCVRIDLSTFGWRPPRERREAQKAEGSESMAKKHGKRYTALAEKIERGREYPPTEAAKLIKDTSQAKFDTTVELHLRMGVDPKHADQMVRGAAVLPNGTGKKVRVIAFAQGDKARDAQAAGADAVGAEDLAKRIEGGWLDFDVAIATPDLMGQVGRLGRVLGPRGLMPNPKSGTVTFDVGKAVRDAKSGKLEYRTDRGANVHVAIGKKSFDERTLLENYAALVDEIVRAKPSAAKGRYINQITIASTMGPGIHVDPTRTRGIVDE